MPIRSSLQSRASAASSAPACTSVSGLSSSTASASLSRSARLLAAEKPMFASLIRRTSGNSRATMSGVPSGLPLSTTVTRISASAGGCSRRERRQSRSSPSAPWLTITASSIDRG